MHYAFNALKKSKQLDEQNNNIALGIPFGIKDIIDASNVPTGFGTPFYKNNILSWSKSNLNKCTLGPRV